MKRAPFFGLPSRTDAVEVFGLAFLYAVVFILFYGGASFLSGYVPWRIHVDFPFESAIPFMPSASLVYLSMDLLVCMAPFVLRDLSAIFPLFATLVAQTLIAALCFILLPVETQFPERHVEGLYSTPFTIADFLNLERNFLPSLHVGLAVTAALAYGKRTAAPGKLFFAAWALAIAISTLLIHEHHLLDVITGVLLAIWMWRTVGKWAASERVLKGLEIERFCFRSYIQFGRRHRRYLLIALLITLASLSDWRQRRVLRTGFCFLQIVDDMLDGDRPCPREPFEVVDQLISAIENERFERDELSQLAQAFRGDLMGAGGRESLDDAITLMRVMQLDRHRVLKRSLLTQEELRHHLRQTFRYSIDLMMVAAGTELRADDVPELVEAFGWCSVMRDLEEDLDAGLVNIPREIVESALAEGTDMSYAKLIGCKSVRGWMHTELLRARKLLDDTELRLAELKGRSGVFILKIFASSIRGYEVHRLPERYPGY